ncbi:hypothetical protein [Natrinema salifodinae]|uniref:Uncharacterized protein n=1 Tax=Natrinema salifodinae TaxID=1202768 RepID=A0A1I0QEC8_9EURY|nr:hypothetical protein [Natrinema salifodinae]SEW25267.1 hypothetical protein SAMN05216285_3436 [Natrinema salifodinae]
MATQSRTRRKAAAQCIDCGTALAVWISSDEIRPIGSADGCPCGGTSFRPFE